MQVKTKLWNVPATATMTSLPQMLEKYNCEKCRFFTKDLNKYNIHIALHNEMKYVCSHCNFESYTKTEFQRHLVSHTGKFPYTCGYCGYGAIRNDYIIKHIKRIHGDGKIICSVSTIENESKNAAVNIVQTQMRTSLQEILPNNTSVLAKSCIDLTSELDNSLLNSNLFYLNGNSSSTNADQVEVEVISPADQQLNPWTPLTVVAPTSFKVPENCLAEVVEVKPVNGTCHLVLRCFTVIDSNGQNDKFSKENLYEKNASELLDSTENSFESSDGSLMQECTPLNGTETPLLALNTVPLTEENPTRDLLRSLNEIENINLQETPNDLIEETEVLSDGPIISSVFSLSSDSQNVIEGIQWESPITVTNKSISNDLVEMASPFDIAESQGRPNVVGTEANCRGKIDKPDQQTIVLESELLGAKDKDPEMKLTFDKPALPCAKKPENQSNFIAQINKRAESKSNRLSKIESFSKPQTLFLSCNKRIVMQPLSCLMQTAHKTEMSMEDTLVHCKKMKLPSAKRKSTFVHKRGTAPGLKTLRLYPFKPDQPTPLPQKNQPVVVLNHPELESLETFSIMRTIGMFKGKVLKVTLSKQMLKKCV